MERSSSAGKQVQETTYRKMELKSIGTGLEIAGLIVKNWIENNKIDEMERALVVRKLHEICEAVETLEHKPAAEPLQEQAPDVVVPDHPQEAPKPKPGYVVVEEYRQAPESGTGMERHDSAVPEEQEMQQGPEEMPANDAMTQTDVADDDTDIPDFELVPDSAFGEDDTMEVVETVYDGQDGSTDFEFISIPDEPQQEGMSVVAEQPQEQSAPEEAGVSDMTGKENVQDAQPKTENGAVGAEEMPEERKGYEGMQTVMFPDMESAAPAPRQMGRKSEFTGFNKHRKLDRKTINRLYGDDDSFASEQVKASAGTRSPETPSGRTKEMEEGQREEENKVAGADMQTKSRMAESDEACLGEPRQEATPVKSSGAAGTEDEGEVTDDDFTLVSTPDSRGMFDMTLEEDVPAENDGENGELHTAQEGTTVLGDVLNAGRKVVADTLGDAGHGDGPSAMSGKLKSLHSAIGINDKFLIARDLFDGNVKACEEALDSLEQMQNIDDALLYIYDHYQWDKTREGTKLVMDALMRKLM